MSYRDATTGDLIVSHCDDLACATATHATVDSAGNVGTSSAITIGSDGFPLISYYDTTNTNLKVAHCEDVDCATATTATVDSTGDVGSYSAVAVASTTGNGVIAYYDTTNTNLKFATCSDIACSASSTATLNGGGTLGQYVSMAIGTDGYPVIAYENSAGQDLFVTHCTTATCTSGTNDIAIDTASTVGRYTSIAINGKGLPVMSYFDSTGENLKVAACVDVECNGSPTVTTVASSGSVGWNASLTIGLDGYPIMSFRDLATSVYVTKCGTADCTASTTSSIRTTSLAGTTSIALTGNGNPIVALRDGASNDLVTVYCSSPHCVPYARSS
jgi:hypothetical protein